LSKPTNYVIGSLYPKTLNGKPNVILSENLKLRKLGRNGELVISQSPNSTKPTALNTSLNITSDPIKVGGVGKFLNNWYLPQIQNKTDSNSIFSNVQSNVIDNWSGQARNKSMTILGTIGYKGPGAEDSATNNDFWNTNGNTDNSDLYWKEINDLDNYDPAELWRKYKDSNTVTSNFDTTSLLQNLESSNKNTNLWYPSLLYTYSRPGKGTSFPGPVLMTTPNSMLNLSLRNKIAIPGLSKQQNQDATTVRVSTYGNSSSDGLGGTTSTNLHVHGLHVNATGFGDNVVARYTTGQKWTSKLTLPSDHGIGSYWYHPHYHPSVNQQVYGGLSGFIQIGDPLSKVPDFSNVPRNLAVIKAIDINVDSKSGELILGATANIGGVANQMTMVTVNGEFQPEVSSGKGGWQSISLSNQANQAMYNVSLIHTDANGTSQTLPAYIYGEDGHQYPQIRQAVGTLGTNNQANGKPYYAQAENLISLPPGKRIDLLVYLPNGKTELASTYSFKGGGKASYKIQNMGGYPDLSIANIDPEGGYPSAGPIAVFNVDQGTSLPSTAELKAKIEAANAGIQVQEILPTTSQAEYDVNKVPSINLYATTEDGNELWKPVRKREFNWAKGTLVGPSNEWDGATQELLKAYTAANNGSVYERYTGVPVGAPGVEDWLGYNQPFLINDHVFPNGNLTIAQLGTMEEWRLRNWSVNSATKYIGHPFHIHVNDYQVKDSDTELVDKNSLEDVTMINSSGFKYYDQKQKQILEQKPLRGNLHTIAEALDPQTSGNLATWGANDQTVRMVFQDYLGTYVYHCHILPHEDAGMMQVISVVENTDSSWIVPTEGFQTSGDDGSITLYQAQSYEPFKLNPGLASSSSAVRVNIGDLNGDFNQDVVLSSSDNIGAGLISVFDGASLNQNQTNLLSQFAPYKRSNLAPWAFAEDFSGDGSRDLVTAGFARRQGAVIDLNDLRLAAWSSPTNNGASWKGVFQFEPFNSIDFSKEHGQHTHNNHTVGEHTLKPSAGLTGQQVSVTMADMNLDNFQDVVIAYALEPHNLHVGLRVIVLDGAAITLQYQTGNFEGGYFPDQSVLADALILDPSLSDLGQLVLTAGFNSYAQSALENVVITTQSSVGAQQFTIQLQAGHFIATSENDSDGGHGGHGSHGGSKDNDDRVINLRDDSMPIHLIEQLKLPDGSIAATPVLSGAFANGAVLSGDQLTLAQGNEANGNPANTNDLLNTTQQLTINLNALLRVDRDDLTGIVTSNLNSTFSASEVQARNQLTALTYQAYAAGTLWPSGQAALAASILGQGQTASQLAETLQTAPGYKTDVENYYGGSLNSLPVAQIVKKAYQALYGTTAREADINQWQQQVNAGLSQSLLPLAILQSTSGIDQYRVALLSATAQWSNAQWGTTANVAGSFGQGFQNDVTRYDNLDTILNAIGTLSSWDKAQSSFDAFTNEALQAMIGTPVSKSGFF
jgi:FtsP/CotA-like multicopper oxidase with cupredoxin domain